MMSVEIRESLKQLTYLEHKVFNELLVMSKKYRILFISQGLLARKVGMTRAYCNRAIKKFKELKLLFVEYRHRHSCIYTINPIIFTADLRPVLSGFFKALCYLPIFLPLALLSSLYTPINSTVLFRIKPSVPYIVRGAVEMQNPIPDYVKNITCLKLAKGGQIKLSGMPQEAIEYAEKHIQYSKNIRDPFNWFFKMCLDYCKQQELGINWAYVDELRTQYKMPNDARMLLDNKIQRHTPVRRTGEIRSVGTVCEKVINKPESVPDRERSQGRLKDFWKRNLQDYQFRKWSKQYQEAEGEFKHALQHMIMDLETVDHGLKYEYYCHDSTCRFSPKQEGVG